MCIVQHYNLQASNIRSLGDKCDKFGNKINVHSWIFIKLSTWRLFFNKFRAIANSSFKLLWALSVVRWGDVMLEWRLNVQASTTKIVNQ